LPAFHDKRYGATVSYKLMEHLTLAGELLRSESAPGNAKQATIQLAVEF